MSIADKCKAANFNVTDEAGAIICLMDKETYFNKTKFVKESRKFRKFLKENDYNGSFGFRPANEATDNR